MTNESNSNLKCNDLTNEQVWSYLKNNPNFFLSEQFQEDFIALKLPHHTAGEVSLLQYQNDLLRESLKKSEQKALKLNQFFNENEESIKKTRQVFIELSQAKNATQLLQRASSCWQKLFDIDAVRIHFYKPEPAAGVLLPTFNLDNAPQFLRSKIEPTHIGKNIFSGNIPTDCAEFLFNDNQIQCACLLPLFSQDKRLALVCLGMKQQDYFKPQNDALLAESVRDVLEALLQMHLS